MQIILKLFPTKDESDVQRLLTSLVGIHLFQTLNRAIRGDITNIDRRSRGWLDKDVT